MAVPKETASSSATAGRGFRRFSRWRKPLLALGAVFCLLLLLEGAVWGWVLLRHGGNRDLYNVWSMAHEADPHSLLRARPGGSFTIFGGRYRVETDSRGFRSPEPEPVKGENAYRIAFLGGSTTFNLEAPSNDDTVPVLAGALLQEAYPHRKVEVINAGMLGYTTMESLTTLVTRVLPLQPDLIVILHGINDAVYRTKGPYRDDYWRPAKPTRSRLDEFCRKWSLAYRYLVYKVTWGRKSPTPSPAILEANRLKNRPAAFERNLRNMIAVAREHDIDLVLCSFHYCTDPENAEREKWDVLFRAVDEQNSRVASLAAERGVPFLDLAARMPCDQALFASQVHRNQKGLRVHSRILADFILGTGLVETAGRDRIRGPGNGVGEAGSASSRVPAPSG